jgi:hypothetical protein
MHKAPVQNSLPPAPSGTHVARLYQIIYLGTLPEDYMGEAKEMYKVRMVFELCNETKIFKDGEPPRPFSIGRDFTFSMGNKANLRKFVEGMIGTALSDGEAGNFDLDELLGHACLLSVVHKEKKAGGIAALIQGASPLVKGMDAPAQSNPSKVWDILEITDEELAALPKWLREKMQTSKEYQSRHGGVSAEEDYDNMGEDVDDKIDAEIDEAVIDATGDIANELPFPSELPKGGVRTTKRT